MKIDKWVEFTPMCDGCSLRGRDFERTGYVMANTRKEAATQAREAGWRVVKGRTLCPPCVEKAKPSPPPGPGIP